MGIELVEGRDLVCVDHKLYMKTISGLKQVDVLYRRIDDDFLDPVVFRPDSMLGVPGLTAVLRAGGAAMANGIGTGVADDKAVYAYSPAMIRYYLGEDPILPIVHTYLLREPEVRAMVLRDLDQFVVKPTGASGGYGVVIGPKASDRELAECRERIERRPGGVYRSAGDSTFGSSDDYWSGVRTDPRRSRRATSISVHLFCWGPVPASCRAG